MILFTEQDIIKSFPASEIRKAKPYAARDVLSVCADSSTILNLFAQDIS